MKKIFLIVLTITLGLAILILSIATGTWLSETFGGGTPLTTMFFMAVTTVMSLLGINLISRIFSTNK